MDMCQQLEKYEVGKIELHEVSNIIQYDINCCAIVYICCGPAKQCSTTQAWAQGDGELPQWKDYNPHQITNLTRYIVGVGPLNQQLKRGPIFHN